MSHRCKFYKLVLVFKELSPIFFGDKNGDFWKIISTTFSIVSYLFDYGKECGKLKNISVNHYRLSDCIYDKFGEGWLNNNGAKLSQMGMA